MNRSTEGGSKARPTASQSEVCVGAISRLEPTDMARDCEEERTVSLNPPVAGMGGDVWLGSGSTPEERHGTRVPRPVAVKPLFQSDGDLNQAMLLLTQLQRQLPRVMQNVPLGGTHSRGQTPRQRHRSRGTLVL